ncbi:MAG: prolyl oligopeptidase family serine peptidase, partial [Deltaproteobacteria bacterium]|nr:prolyl oligopeptidase family serine peptidase [Deltaproteobacteria bacterium]
RYFVDNHSDANRPPRADLRSTDGALIAELTRADISALDAMGYAPPERMMVKAADGKSDVCCALYTPADFDPTRSYPVIEVIYGGPQWHVVPRKFAAGETGNTAAALARLGYVTVIIDSPGTAGRGKVYQDAVFEKLGQIEIPDHVAALRNLAATRPWMDLERVGIHGKSWGGYFTIRAMLQAPEFYKVGVASSAVVDLVTTADSPVVPYLGRPADNPESYAAANCIPLADQLQGELLMTIGTSDRNTPFAHSMQMLSAFIEAGKDVDLLVLPGQHHWLQGKSFLRWQRGLRDYFEDHLPPVATAPARVAEINESRFESSILDEDVGLQIALPVGYERSNGNYPVLYLLDGEFFMNQAISAVDFLSTPRYMNSVIPGYIIVGITTEDRNHDFTPTHDDEYDGMPFPTSGGAPTFQRFLREELIPFVDSNFRTADSRILTGWSLGGLFTTWTYFEHPDLFNRYLAISPSLWWDDMVLCDRAEELVKSQSLSPRRLTVTLGGLERGAMDESVKGTFVPLMKEQGIESGFEFIEIIDEGHNTSPLSALQKGLVSLHRMVLIPDSIVDGDRADLGSYLIELVAARGLRTDDPDAAGQFLIKLAVDQGEYEVGLQIAMILADKLVVSPRSMIAVGEMAFRLNRFEESVAAFETAIAREEALKEPDPEELKYFQSYLEWIKSKLE